MILLSKTYQETTPESAQDGDYSDQGFVFEDSPCTFRELIAYLRECSEPSCTPFTGDTVGLWFSSYPEVIDYATCTERSEAIHYSRKNRPRALKYWSKALRVVFGANHA